MVSGKKQQCDIDLKYSYNRFNNYKKKSKIIREVILDDTLLHDGWKLKFIVDYHNIYEVAFPNILKKKTKRNQHTEQDVEWFVIPDEDEQKSIYLNRIIKAIPFFGTLKCDVPYLIEPYIYELETSLRSKFEKVKRDELKKHINELTAKLDPSIIKKDWKKLIKQDDPDKDNIEQFAKLITDGMYLAYYINSLGVKTLQNILKDKNDVEHVKELPYNLYEIVTSDSIQQWKDVLNHYRPKRPLQNAIDAIAIECVIKLNQIKEDRTIYFLLSDAHTLWNVLKEESLYISSKYSLFPSINRKDLPEYCNVEGINILRTSYHFEEWLKTYHRQFKCRIKYLKEREKHILPNLKLIPSLRSDEIENKCKICLQDNKCNDSTKKECKQIIDNINKVIGSEYDVLQINSIIQKNAVFSNLLSFINDSIDPNYYKDIKSIVDMFDKYFIKFDEKTSEKFFIELRAALSTFRKVVNVNIENLNSSIINFSDIPLKYRFERVDGILLHITFKNNSIIYNIISKSIDEEGNFTENFRTILEHISSNYNNPDASLLASIILYCNEDYTACSWLTEEWKNQYKKEKNERIVEFTYLWALSKSRIIFGRPNIKERNDKIEGIIKELESLHNNNKEDPRIPYLISKIIARKHLFNINTTDKNLYRSIEYCHIVGNIINNNISNYSEKEKDDYLLLQMLNNNVMLWCISKLSKPNNNLIVQAKKLYQLLNKSKKKSHFIETIASYYYLLYKFQIKNSRERKRKFREAISTLIESLKIGFNQDINKQETHVMLLEYDNWRIEYIKKYKDDKFINDKSAEIEKLTHYKNM